MVLVTFTENIQRHVPCPPQQVTAGTLRAVLDAVFDANPRARGYVLDDQGALRKHMVVFIGATQSRDRQQLSDVVPDGSEVSVFQALSGG